MATSQVTTSRHNSQTDFLLADYKNIMNTYAAGMGIPQPFPEVEPVLRRVPFCPELNFSVACQAEEAFGSSTGEQDLPCGQTPTRRCPGCGEWSDLCEAHLFEQEDGTRVCGECDGKPEFAKYHYSVASELDADEWDAELLREKVAVRS